MKLKKRNGKIEIMFCLLIFVDLIIMITFSDYKFRKFVEISNSYEYAHIDDNYTSEKLSSLIQEYMPGSHRMYEHYDENFNLIYRYMFDNADGSDNAEEIDPSLDIRNYPNLIRFLNENDKGKTHYDTGKDEAQSVYFQWAEDKDGKRYCNIIYTNRYVLSNNGILYLDFCGYIAMFLIFSVVVILIQRNHADKVKFYNQLTQITQNSSIYDDVR